MYYIGIDIGSTGTKVIVLDEARSILYRQLLPTGWSSVDTAEAVRAALTAAGYDPAQGKCVATGYGRVSVPYADKTVTEITCHGKGAAFLFDRDTMTVVDIGGQDTKLILLENGNVKDFVMNDKCSAGTGRFLEVMANAMAMDPASLCELARSGSGTKISSMCTVFAESEVISLIGRGESRENIAYAVVSSIADKVVSQCQRLGITGDTVYLTGGLCGCPFLLELLSQKLRRPVHSIPDSRYAGAVGAALHAMRLK